MAQTASNVSAAKPWTGGALSVGPTTATLPNATGTTLTGFTSLGYISEDGFKNDVSRKTEEVKVWGGENVLRPQTGFTDTFKCKLLEVLNPDVLKEVYGLTNVSGTLQDGITVSVDATELTERAWVCDMIMRDNTAKRVVIPKGKVTEIGEVVYKDSEAVGYEITITAFPDSTGRTHYEHIKATGTTSSTS